MSHNKKMSHNEKKKEETKRKEKKKPSRSICYFPQSWSFPCCLFSNLLLPCASNWSSGGRAAALMLRCLGLGGDAPPFARCLAQWEVSIP